MYRYASDVMFVKNILNKSNFVLKTYIKKKVLLGNEGRGAKLFCTNVEVVPPRRQLEGTKSESCSKGPVLTHTISCILHR